RTLGGYEGPDLVTMSAAVTAAVPELKVQFYRIKRIARACLHQVAFEIDIMRTNILNLSCLAFPIYLKPETCNLGFASYANVQHVDVGIITCFTHIADILVIVI